MESECLSDERRARREAERDADGGSPWEDQAADPGRGCAGPQGPGHAGLCSLLAGVCRAAGLSPCGREPVLDSSSALTCLDRVAPAPLPASGLSHPRSAFSTGAFCLARTRGLLSATVGTEVVQGGSGPGGPTGCHSRPAFRFLGSLMTLPQKGLFSCQLYWGLGTDWA